MSAPPPAPPAPPDAHTTLHGGRYVLLGPLGTGSQGTTWDAVDRREGRAVAVKRFDVRGATAWKGVRSARETKACESGVAPASYWESGESPRKIPIVRTTELVEYMVLSTTPRRA